MLCIGGPSDGRHITVGDDAKSIGIPDPPKQTSLIMLAGGRHVVSSTVTPYVEMLFRGRDTAFVVLVPEGATPDNTIERLIQGYRQDAKS
jgi:hypothetical protein